MVLLNYVEIGKRIRERRKYLGLTQKELGIRMNLSEGTISKYEAGKLEEASTTRFNEFAEKLGVDLIWLLNIPVSVQSNVKMVNLPIIGRISCGNGSLAYEEIEGYEPTPESWLNVGGEYFYLRAKGNSMKNARIQEGDLLLIRQQTDVDDGDIAAVLINDEAVLKRVYKHNGTLLLQSENPDYPPIICDGKGDYKVKILGKLKRTVITY